MSRFAAALTTGYAHLALATAIQVVLIPFLLARVGTEITWVYLLLASIGQFAAIGIGWLAGAGVRVVGESEASLVNFRFQDVHQAVFLGFAAYGLLFFTGAVLASLCVGNVWLHGLGAPFVSQTRFAVVFLGLYVLINYAHQADLSLLVARLEQARANMYRAAAPALFTLIAVPLMLLWQRIDLLFLAQFVSAAICLVLLRVSLYKRRLLSYEWHLPRADLVRTLAVRVGIPYFLFGAAQFVLQLGDTLLVGFVLGPAAVAAYTVMAKAPDLIGIIAGRISETLSPYFVKMDTAPDRRSELAELYLTTARLQHIIAIMAGVAFATVGPWVLEIWVGPRNRPQSSLAFVAAGAYIFFQIVNRHDVNLHYGCAKVGRVIPVQFLEAAAKIVLTLLLFARFGFMAPLVAYVVVQVLGISAWYRALGVHTAGTTWREWFHRVGRISGLLILATVLWTATSPATMTWQLPQVLVFTLTVAAIFLMMARRPIMALRALG